MTERLYYTDPNLTEFDACIVAVEPSAIVLDRTAFYPTSGGQLVDTGVLQARTQTIPVLEVREDDRGDIVHIVAKANATTVGEPVHGVINRSRRREHMQQHTGQHLLSAVFIELLNAPTVSFHMGDETCTIDLDVKSLTMEQIRDVERRCNEIVADDVPVEIKFASLEEVRAMGVRKIPAELTDTLRLIEIRGHGLTACGGTHVSRTGEIGGILLRKSDKVKQGMRVEFVCGARAIATARRDFETLTASAGLFSSHIYDVAEQIRKLLDEARTAAKREQKSLAEVAEFMAANMVAETAEINGIRLVRRIFADREVTFVKLLAQKLAAHPGVVALLASTNPQPALVFAQSASGPFDMGALMKQAMSALGGRGGGSRDMAQGGAPAGADIEGVLNSIVAALRDGS